MTECNCGNCVYLIKDDGEPYYCAIQDLYTFRKAEDTACQEWSEVEDGKE